MFPLYVQLLQHHLLRKLAGFPPLNFYCILIKKSVVHIYEGLSLDSLFCYVDLYVHPSVNTVLVITAIEKILKLYYSYFILFKIALAIAVH